MKNFKILILVAAAAALTTINSHAQGRGDDLFGVPRSIVLCTPQTLVPGTATVTNGPIDTHSCSGVAIVDLSTVTNIGTGALTATFETSSDLVTWGPLQNYANAVSSSVSITNLLIGTNTIATQTKLAPGTATVPTAATAGWATPYLVPSPFTNSGALTVTAKGFYEIGYNVSDQNRYLHVIWTPTTVTNATVSAVFKGYFTQ